MTKCDHVCTSNCRREGCNCQCGEYHNDNTESQNRERLLARTAILAQNGLLPDDTVEDAENQYLVEEAKNSILSDLHVLNSLLGKDATQNWLTSNYA